MLAALATRTDLLGQRDYALVATALLTGLRSSELAHLELAHLDLDGGALRVVEGKGQKDRELPNRPAARGDPAPLPFTEVRDPLVNRPVGQIREGRAMTLAGPTPEVELARN